MNRFATLFLSDSASTLEHEETYPLRTSISFDTLEYDPNAEVKVFVQMEPPSVFDIREELIESHETFDLILGWEKTILDLPNAEKLIFGTSWIDWETFKQEEKRPLVTFLLGDKTATPGHIFRQAVWKHFPRCLDYMNVSVHRSPPWVTNRNVFYESAMFSVAIENEKLDNWITEKLIDCLVTKTIPIYWGCPNISEYFDPGGMILFNTKEELYDILDNLTPELYEERKQVIGENAAKAEYYRHFHSRINTAIREAA